MKRTIYLILFLFPSLLNAQVDTIIQDKFEKVKQLMADSLYFKANEVFVDLLTPEEVLPDELCYYFGKNLFLTGYKDQSRSFLYQYIALRDTSDQYFQPTIDLLKLLGEDMSDYDPEEETTDTLKGIDNSAPKTVKKHNKGENQDCHTDEVFMCPVCNGTTVLVRRGSFGNSYQTCPYCDENGIMDCETYKLYLSGELYNR
jgi:hypothetical protein